MDPDLGGSSFFVCPDPDPDIRAHCSPKNSKTLDHNNFEEVNN